MKHMLLIAAIILLAYSVLLNGNFILDDYNIAVNNNYFFMAGLGLAAALTGISLKKSRPGKKLLLRSY